jgi:hypothetical protein
LPIPRASPTRRSSFLLALALIPVLSGCGQVRGLSPSLESQKFAGVAERQDTLVADLQKMAGFGDGDKLAAIGDPRWFQVVKAGMEFQGGQCDEYLSALFNFDREQKALRQGLTATGATTATVLGLTLTPAAPIAITAAGFGLAASLFDADVNSVLFDLSPSGVRNIVVQSEDAYRDSVTSHADLYQSRSDALLALQGYLRLCTPAVIESAVNKAAETTQFVAKAPTANDPAPSLQQTSSLPISLGTLGAADRPTFLSTLAIKQGLGGLQGQQIVFMARQMLPLWNQLAGDPTLAPLQHVFGDWQTNPAHAKALMFSWLSTRNTGPLDVWDAALRAAQNSPR